VIIVEKLSVNEAPEFRSLRLLALETNPADFSASLEDEIAKPLSWFETILDKGLVVGGRDTSGVLVGMAGLDVPTGRKKCHKGTIWTVYVAPSARRIGCAKNMIERLIDLRPDSLVEIGLGVARHNIAALAFYQRLGFETLGVDRRALKIDGDYVDEIIMSQAL